MKKREMLAALNSRIKPLEKVKDGLLCGGFTEIGASTLRDGDNNGSCSNDESCYGNQTCYVNKECKNNNTCSNNGSCNNNSICNGSYKGSTEESDILDFSTIF